MFLNNKYFKIYQSIIDYRLQHVPTGYSEKHHIIPKSLGGSNGKNNLVRLTAREHFICHRLLVRCTENEARRKMVYALKRTLSSRKHITNSRVFAQIREDFAMEVSKLQTGRKLSASHCANISKGGKGIEKTESFKAQMRDRLNDEERDAPRRAKIRAALTGRTPSPESLKKGIETRRRNAALRKAESEQPKLEE